MTDIRSWGCFNFYQIWMLHGRTLLWTLLPISQGCNMGMMPHGRSLSSLVSKLISCLFTWTSSMARLFFMHIFNHHVMSHSIVGDRDSRTTSLFRHAVFDDIGTKLKLLPPYHPSTYSKSEIANFTVFDLLKCRVSNQHIDWEKYHPVFVHPRACTFHSVSGAKTPRHTLGASRAFWPSILKF